MITQERLEFIKSMMTDVRHKRIISELATEVERLQAERQNHTLIHNDALSGLIAENERLYRGNIFSCGCRFSASPIGWGWDFCDTHASVYLLQKEVQRLQASSRALANLRAAAQAVIEQADRDQAIGLGSQFSRLDLYEVVLTGEQVEALRVALVEGGGK